MSINDQKLKLELTKKIKEWILEQCETDQWPNFYSHEAIEDHMSDAAFIVFQACVSNQDFFKKENGVI